VDDSSSRDEVGRVDEPLGGGNASETEGVCASTEGGGSDLRLPDQDGGLGVPSDEVATLRARVEVLEASLRRTQRFQDLTREELERSIVRFLNRWADLAEKVPGPPQYEDALRDAAEAIERGDYLKPEDS
jgi:hypothetical protein